MQKGFYDYSLRQAYLMTRGTMRGKEILNAAKYILKDYPKEMDISRLHEVTQAEHEVNRLLGQMPEDDRMLSFLERIGERLTNDIAFAGGGGDISLTELEHALRVKEHTALAEQSLNIFVSDENTYDNYGYEPEDIQKAASSFRTHHVPAEIQKFLKMLKKEPGFVDESEASEEEREMNSWNEKGEVYRPMAQVEWWDDWTSLTGHLLETLPESDDDTLWRFVGAALVPADSDLRFARFDSHRNRIILYLDNIVFRCRSSGIPFEAGFYAAYAKARFLASFYYWMEGYGSDTSIWRYRDGWSLSIREGLSDYFAYTWCRMNAEIPADADEKQKNRAAGFGKMAEYLENTWKGRGFPGFPAASAQVYRAWELFGTKEEGAEKPWLSDDSLTYRVIYAQVTAPDESEGWEPSRKALLQVWKSFRAAWVKKLVQDLKNREKSDED